ncbi:MAG: TraR/DksA C4-type zinc finger protein [Vicingaceae bacterium]
MQKSERKELEQKIAAETTKLEVQINELKELVKPIAPENAIGRLSRMDAINNRSVNEAALRKAQMRLRALEEAKGSLNQSDFGICLRCGDRIPIGRLLLRPQSRSCVKCAH